MASEPKKAWYARRRFRVWFSGLSATVIHGVAAAGGAFVGVATAKGFGVDVPQFNLKQLGIVLFASGLSCLFAFLRASPLPKAEDDTKPFHPMKLTPLIALGILLAGCTALRIEQTDESPNDRKITTTVKATAWFSSAQTLAKLKAITTDKTQSIGTDQLTQHGATNSVEALRQLARILELLRPTP
jgi:small neutral amino acid transporter SnatA (MarC family)